ncbi:TRIC channel [Carpediemonas membranifera]|uniref:TRIC channel n=1 Tax=Carpediemonas membranifera TaxID=201153 RepID=A0A8J6E782_9EUKA|nr:TRIC channel [Carpediemonas membranifera]|eukprot:KAG9390415.1 TRIC channel [Carpediemonas membranifera]
MTTGLGQLAMILGDKIPFIFIGNPSANDFFHWFNTIPMFPIVISAHILSVMSAWIPNRRNCSILYLYIIGFFMCFSGGSVAAFMGHSYPGWVDNPRLIIYYTVCFTFLVMPPRCVLLRFMNKTPIRYAFDVLGQLSKLDTIVVAMNLVSARHASNQFMVLLSGIVAGSVGALVAAWEARLQTRADTHTWANPARPVQATVMAAVVYYLVRLNPTSPFVLSELDARALVFWLLIAEVIYAKWFKVASIIRYSPIEVMRRLITMRPMETGHETFNRLLGVEEGAKPVTDDKKTN